MAKKQDYKQEGQQLKKLRIEANLTQGELAEKAGLSAAMISTLEGGATKPSTKTREALGQIFGENAIAQISWPKAHAPISYNNALFLEQVETLTTRQLLELKDKHGLGAVLKTLRLMLPEQPTQEELANRAGLTVAYYRHLEGRGGKPGHKLRLTSEVADKLTEVFGQAIQVILGFADAEPDATISYATNQINHVQEAQPEISDYAPPVVARLKAHRKKFTVADSSTLENALSTTTVKLREFRFSLPGRPTQADMAQLLGISSNSYRYLEGKSATKFSKNLPPEIKEKLIAAFGDKAQSFFADIFERE